MSVYIGVEMNNNTFIHEDMVLHDVENAAQMCVSIYFENCQRVEYLLKKQYDAVLQEKKNWHYQLPYAMRENVERTGVLVAMLIFFLAPTKRYSPGSIGSFLDQWLVKLATRSGVDLCPTVLTVVLQTRDIRTEEGSKLAPTASPLTFITHLVVKHVRLHFNLKT